MQKPDYRLNQLVPVYFWQPQTAGTQFRCCTELHKNSFIANRLY